MADAIKLLQYLQNRYRMVGIYPPQSNQRSGSFNIKNSIFISFLAQLLISSTAFLLFKAESAYDYGFSFFTSISQFQMCVFYPIIVFKMPDILTLIKNYEEFIEKRMHDSVARSMYKQLNEKIEYTTEILYLVVVKITSVGCVVPHLLLTLGNYFIHDLGDESYVLPCPMMLPFNWKTPLGYFVAYLIVSGATVATLYCGYLIFCFLIGSCWLSITIVEDITNDLISLNIGKVTHETHQKLKRSIINAVQFHSDSKQLVDDFNGIYQYITTGYFLWALLSIASTLLAVQRQLSEHIFGFELINILIVVNWSFTCIFLFCIVGELVTHQFNVFNDELCMCDWYMFPLELQRILLIFMANAQQPATIRGFANTICTREAFKQTANGGFSYFMMLRHFKG